MRHPSDWERFFVIIIYAVENGLENEFGPSDISDILNEYNPNLDEDIVARLSTVYSYGADLIKYYKANKHLRDKIFE